MDWLTILSSLSGGAFAGSGITSLLHARANRRKANAEASQSEAQVKSTDTQTKSAEIDALNKIIASLQEERDHYLKSADDKEKRIESLVNENINLREQIATSNFLICSHLGCAGKNPLQGLGGQWYQDHKDDPALGADYDPINIILKKLGKKRIEELENIKIGAENGKL